MAIPGDVSKLLPFVVAGYIGDRVCVAEQPATVLWRTREMAGFDTRTGSVDYRYRPEFRPCYLPVG